MTDTSIQSGLTYQGPLSQEAERVVCADHPDARSRDGFGYDGGGFGPYKKCCECGRVFGKKDMGGPR